MAFETTTTTGSRAVLRVTPPFNGRMRARLHRERDPETPHRDGDSETPHHDGDPETAGRDDTNDQDGIHPIHIDPEMLLENPPPYPRPAATEDDLRADPTETYTVERHREYHTARVREWRETVPAHIRDHVALPTPDGPHVVTVKTLHSEC